MARRTTMKTFSCIHFVIFLLLTLSSSLTALTTTSPPLTANKSPLISTKKPLRAAVLIPGFLTGADEFKPLCKLLTEEHNIPTVAVPMPNWHWIPCLGGRSVRPMLERIDFAVRHLIALMDDHDAQEVWNKQLPKFDYNLWDMWNDFQANPGGVMEVGGSFSVDSYPADIQPQGRFILPPEEDLLKSNSQIALIGHSAGGWMARAYISERPYGGKSYRGRDLVHSLVTLGTPHGTAPGPAFESVEWCNRESGLLVPSLAVGGRGFKGGEWGTLTQGSYAFCCPDGTDGTLYTGDGVTPIQSSTLAYEGAEVMELDDVTHFCWSDVFGSSFVAPELTEDHKKGRPWYGSKEVVEEWASWIKDRSL